MTVPPAVHAAAVRLADADAFIDDEFVAKDLEVVLGWVFAAAPPPGPEPS